MTRRERRRERALARAGASGARSFRDPKQRPRISNQLGSADRKALLLGTALASTLLLGSLVASPPAAAGVVNNCSLGTTADAVRIPLVGTSATPITCNNSLDRFDPTVPYAIGLYTAGAGATVTVTNTGELTTGPISDTAFGLIAFTQGSGSTIDIDNRGGIRISTINNSHNGYGIHARTVLENSRIDIDNRGDIQIDTTNSLSSGYGIKARTERRNSRIDIDNHGEIRINTIETNSHAYGIHAETEYANSRIDIDNRGDIRIKTIESSSRVNGIYADTEREDSYVTVQNSGDLWLETTENESRVDGFHLDTTGINADVTLTTGGDLWIKTAGNYSSVDGFDVETNNTNANLKLTNSGDIRIETTGEDSGVEVFDVDTNGDGATLELHNSGDIWVRTTARNSSVEGFDVETDENSYLTLKNSGDIWIETRGNGSSADAFDVDADEANSDLRLENSGDIWLKTAGNFSNVEAFEVGTRLENTDLTLKNTGDVWGESRGEESEAYGFQVYTRSRNSKLSLENSGDIRLETHGLDSEAYGIQAYTEGANSSLSIRNSGNINVISRMDTATGIDARTEGPNSPIAIWNAGSVYAAGKDSTGIFASSFLANPTRITNTGDIGASSQRAIDAKGAGRTFVYNSGLLRGYIDLTNQSDRVVNEPGGVFETRLDSLFRDGNDLFVNEAGGTVLAGTYLARAGASSFQGLERFQNRGTISLQDGGTGDTFTISNTVGDSDLKFEASGNSTLVVDSFLGGPLSDSDRFILEGDVSGRTEVQVFNTNTGPGVFNPDGILVVDVKGATPNPNAFQLAQPIDTGFFDYDLFFTPTNSGFWELRSFPGGGAHLLPQLLTAAQDIWHQGSSTWFDRTADLRVLMAGGAAPTAYDPSGGKSVEAVGPYPLTPAVWARGSGGWLDRDDSARTRAFGRNYTFDLDRELTTIDFQVGVDMGSYDVLGQGDALVFGVLGGFVHGALDYDAIARSFDYDGGQVGAYATYLNGGLFVDTLLNAHIYSLETGGNLGFPGSLDANTVGLRTDAGYRFGSFTGGAFLEPLATIEVMWADIDGFSLGGNTVSFNDEANVRGRLGLRAGTTMQAWEGTLMEPFVIGSLWSNLSNNNSATLVSTGTTFRFNDDLEDVWGEISAGVNFFNFSQTTAVFAKVDVTVGDDISGVGGKAGMRVNW